MQIVPTLNNEYIYFWGPGGDFRLTKEKKLSLKRFKSNLRTVSLMLQIEFLWVCPLGSLEDAIDFIFTLVNYESTSGSSLILKGFTYWSCALYGLIRS